MDDITELIFETFPVEGMPDIRGVQYHGWRDEKRDNGTKITEYLTELGWDVYHEISHSPDYSRIHEEIRVKMPSGTTTINPGDWVMEDPNGQIYVLPESVVWKKWDK